MSEFVLYINPDRDSVKIHRTNCRKAKNYDREPTRPNRGWFGPTTLTEAREIAKFLQPDNEYPFCRGCGLGVIKGEPKFSELRCLESTVRNQDER